MPSQLRGDHQCRDSGDHGCGLVDAGTGTALLSVAMINLRKNRNYYIACGLSTSHFILIFSKMACVTMLFPEKMRIIFISIRIAVPVRFHQLPIRRHLPGSPSWLLTWLLGSFQRKVLYRSGSFVWRNAPESRKSFQTQRRFGIDPLPGSCCEL